MRSAALAPARLEGVEYAVKGPTRTPDPLDEEAARSVTRENAARDELRTRFCVVRYRAGTDVLLCGAEKRYRGKWTSPLRPRRRRRGPPAPENRDKWQLPPGDSGYASACGVVGRGRASLVAALGAGAAAHFTRFV